MHFIGPTIIISSKNSVEFMSRTQKLMILDGGMGRHLGVKHNVPIWDRVNNHFIWSAWGIIEPKYHHSVINAHLDYLYAGAHIITTCNFCITPLFMEGIGQMDKLYHFTSVSANLAGRAKEIYGNPNIWIAGSIPPLGKSYVPNTYSEMDSMHYYEQIISALYHNDIHIFLAETMSSIQEVIYVLEAMQSVCKNNNNKYIETWISLSLNNHGNLRSNETINDALQMFESYININNITHFGFNCCTPESIDMALHNLNTKSIQIMALNNIKLIIYPNKFSIIDTQYKASQNGLTECEVRTDLSTNEIYQQYIKKWINNYDSLGIIGGCCEIDDECIRYFVNNIKVDYPNKLLNINKQLTV